MEGLVYILCMAAALACTVLLARGFQRTKVRLLLWSAFCFAALTVENAILFVDLVIVPDVSLAVPRRLTALSGIAVLIYGLVWDVK